MSIEFDILREASLPLTFLLPNFELRLCNTSFPSFGRHKTVQRLDCNEKLQTMQEQILREINMQKRRVFR